MKWLVWIVPMLACARFMPGERAPIDRLIKNTSDYVSQNPNDANGQYVLGRLHSMAFSQQTEARVYRAKNQPIAYPFPDSPNGPPRPDQPAPLKPEDRRNAEESLAHYRKAVELKPSDPLYHFSLAWMTEQCARFASQLGTKSKDAWIDDALAEYRKAYDLAAPEELKKTFIAPFEIVVAQEAGKIILEILKTRPSLRSKFPTAQISRDLEKLSKKSRAVTPVVFPCEGTSSLDDLVSPHRVAFDLDGFAEGRQWTWVKRSACMLVWDPDRTGRITSGKQLFGSVTWWMFWRNGYEPLAALDDNRDGKLTGEELRGIAVWRDANENGVSDPGEVTPAEDFGISGILVHPSDGLANPTGIRFANGRVAASYDWMPVGQIP